MRRAAFAASVSRAHFPMYDPHHPPPCAVSVRIPAYNEEVLLGRTLDSVHASFAALEIAKSGYEIIVCDNNSTDGTAREAAVHGAQVVFEPHNQISKARNAAAGRAKHPWLIFLDADTLLNPALLRATLSALASGRICGGGTLVQFDRSLANDFANALLLTCWNKISAGLALAAGSYIFCLRSAWEAVGGFEEGVYAGEEIFFSRKVKRWGRERRLRFVVLSGTPIVTSARKIQWHGRREDCALWYERPPQ